MANSMLRFLLAIAIALAAGAAARAEELSPALKELAAAANKEGSITLSWSQSTLAGIQGAARFQAAINKMFGTNIRINFVPGPDMARIVNQLATEFTAGRSTRVFGATSPMPTPLTARSWTADPIELTELELPLALAVATART